MYPRDGFPQFPVVLLAGALGSLLLVACWGGVSSGSIDFLKILPPEANFLVMVRFQDVVDGPLGILVVPDSSSPSDPETEKTYLELFKRETGFAVHRDLDRIAFAAELGPWGPERFVSLWEGDFDQELIRQWFSKRFSQKTTYRGRDLLSVPFSPVGNQQEDCHLGFLGTRLAVAGDPQFVARTIDLADGVGRGILGSPGWSLPLDRVDRGASVWAVLSSPSLFEGWARAIQAFWPRFDLGVPVSRLRGLILEADVSAGVDVAIRGFLDTEGEAESLLESLRAAFALLRHEYGERNLPLRYLLDSIRVESSPDGIQVRFQVPLDFLEEFRWEAPEIHEAGWKDRFRPAKETENYGVDLLTGGASAVRSMRESPS